MGQAGPGAGVGASSWAPCVSVSLPFFLSDWSSAGVSDSPQITREGSFCCEYPEEKSSVSGKGNMEEQEEETPGHREGLT